VSNELISVGCISWFFICWTGYTQFARRRAKNTHCIASVLHRHRITWMKQLLYRDHLIADTALLASLERQVSFFASTTILILAALLTLLGTSDKLYLTLNELPSAFPSTLHEIQARLILMIGIFIYAFFTFTWSMRQYAFCSVLIGAFPKANKNEPITEQHQQHVINVAKIIDHAGHSYNYGLRSYYFAMSTLAWFVHPALFVFACSAVVIILYKREFKSNTLKVMSMIDAVDQHLTNKT
jgi:uncharacterized membrane protein